MSTLNTMSTQNPSSRKFHLALTTERFDAMVAFYRAFFGGEPVKHKPGYAKFEVEDPALNLTLDAAPEGVDVPRGEVSHLGIQVSSTAAVEEARERLAEHFDLRNEDDVDCCYALQDKVWVTDPDGRGWEVFTVKVADTRPDLQAAPSAAACC